MSHNKETAMAFLRLASSGRVTEAYEAHVANNFRHHNPYFGGDAASLKKGMEENARQNPDKQCTFLRALDDGDLVAVHSHIQQKPGDAGAVVVHIFRFEGDRIAELWDVGQAVPPGSANSNGML